GVSPQEALDMDEQGYALANKTIQEGFQILQKGDYERYYEHWMRPAAIGDPTDATLVLRHLLGQVSYEVLDLKLVDVTELFEGEPHPSWVAATLVEVARKY